MHLQAALLYRSQDTATPTGSKSTIGELAFISPTTDSPRLGGPGMPRMPAPPRRWIRPCHWRWAKTEANGHYPGSSKDDRIVGLPRRQIGLLSTAPARSSQIPRAMGERPEAHSSI